MAFAGLGLEISAIFGYRRGRVWLQRGTLQEQRQLARRSRSKLEGTVAALRELGQNLSRFEFCKGQSNLRMVDHLNSHLTRALACSQILLNRAGERWGLREADALGGIQRQTDRIKESMGYLRELAALEAGGLHMLPIDAGVILRDAVDYLCFPDAGEVVCLGEGHADCPPIAADGKMLVELLTFLALNALNHNPPGTAVFLDANLDQRLPGQVVFSCRETGGAIPGDHRRDVHIEGTALLPGLGLAFCRAVVDAHGGRIWYVAEKGVGTARLFTVAVAE